MAAVKTLLSPFTSGVSSATAAPLGPQVANAAVAPALAAPLVGQAGPGVLCTQWTYQLVVHQTYPSRMAMVKNALGNSVNIVTPWRAPSPWPAIGATWTTSGTVSGPVGPVNTVNTHTWSWTVSFLVPTLDPGPPFVAFDPVTGVPTIGTGGVSVAPQDVVGKSSTNVNWGLEIFSTTFGDSTTGTLIQPVDTNDTGDVTKIEAAMNFFSALGLDADGATPTIGGLTFAKTLTQATVDGATVTDYAKKSFTIPMDPKFTCGRKNVAILVTDGLSNIYNPVSMCSGATWGGNWAEPCLACGTPCSGASGGRGCPDGGPSGSECPQNYKSFGAGVAEDIYNLVSTNASVGMPINANTFVIGISRDVGPCELNYTAYMGRTDASDPNGRAGLGAGPLADPHIPVSTGDTAHYDAPSCLSAQPHMPPHGHYAFFADNSGSLVTAIGLILSASLQGDFTTSAPTASASPLALGAVALIGSASYPGWLGHLYQYDLSKPPAPTVPCGAATSDCLWDAGEVLSRGALNSDGVTRQPPNNSVTRRIYTWDPNATPPSLPKVIRIENTVASLAALNTVCTSCTTPFTSQMIDFILGNDGTLTNTTRSWMMGAVINSTAAVVGAPEKWRQNNFGHAAFENTYATRHSLIWVGGSDGMLHAFDYIDGAEMLALIPPDLLQLQIDLYNTYKADPVNATVGQVADPTAHKFGIANSPRFADVLVGGQYKTVLFLAEGPAGTGLHAIDVTHPFYGRTIGSTTYSCDPNYGDVATCDPTKNPIQPLWSATADGKNGSHMLPLLRQTWSIPGLGGSKGDPSAQWDLLVGGGWDPSYGRPHGYRLNPADGTTITTGYDYATTDLANARVHNQSFADSVMWGTLSPYFKPDNLVNQGVQADLNGRLWTVDLTTALTTPTELFTLGTGLTTTGDPIYYPPAVANYPPSSSRQWNLYAFGSGAFYEKNAAISGATIGDATSATAFVPSVFMYAKKIGAATDCKIAVPLRSIDVKATATSTATGKLGRRTQLTAPPLIITPGTGTPYAMFLTFDPDAAGCLGNSYLVRLYVDPNSCAATSVWAANIGTGASGGLAILQSGDIVRSQSGLDKNRAGIYKTGEKAPPPESLQDILWWQELQ